MGILRLLLACVVVLGHSAEPRIKILSNDGGLAVVAFFVISGFYMDLITHKYQLEKLTTRHLKDFYISRFLRIYPIYWVCLILTLFAAYSGLISVTHMPDQALASLDTLKDKAFYLIENIFIWGQALGRFLVYDPSLHGFILDPLQKISDPQLWGSGYPLLGQAWTLSLELAFYVLVPFLLTRRLWLVASICIFSIVLKKVISWYGWSNYNIEHTFFPAMLGIFLLGSIAHRIIYQFLVNLSWDIQFCGWFALICLGFYIFAWYPHHLNSPNKDLFFVGVVTLTIPFLFAGFKNSKIDNWLGEFSYPIYMTHFLFLDLAKKSSYPGLVAIGCAFITSIFLIYLIVKPIDLFRHRRLLRQNIHFLNVSIVGKLGHLSNHM
jgi:peptidoglycan/LPS O-acetylase OafA/YrhL